MSEIKAIDTIYNGYKFRSRLEARWAVFFDAAGIPYEYEQNGGFEFDGITYLPDFYLPEHSLLIEIKPFRKGIPKKEDIYLAGKVTKNGWRNEIVNMGEDVLPENARHLLNAEKPSVLAYGCGYHAFMGPVLVGCDHGCFHGDTRHGAGAGQEVPCCGQPITRAEVFTGNIKRLAASTVVFAWIDCLDCYATLAEIGYAAANGVKVWLGISSKIDPAELWFVKRFAHKCVVADTAKEAFEKCVPALPVEWTKIKLAAEGLGEKRNIHPHPKPSICYGAPNPNYWQMKTEPVELAFIEEHYAMSLLMLQNRDAAAEARQARFEHGETPCIRPSQHRAACGVRDAG